VKSLHNIIKRSIARVSQSASSHPPRLPRESGESGRTGLSRPTLLTQQAGTHPPIPCHLASRRSLPTQAPPGRPRYRLASPPQSQAASDTPVSCACCLRPCNDSLLVRQQTGGSVPRAAACAPPSPANTKHVLASPAYSHYANADSTRLTSRLTQPRAPWEPGSLPGAQAASSEREPDKECEMRASAKDCYVTQLLRTKNMSTHVRTIKCIA